MYISIEECVYILMNQHTTIGIRLKGPTKIRIIYNIYIYITMRHCEDIIRQQARISLTQIGS
jgi:hypothetical protein